MTVTSPVGHPSCSLQQCQCSHAYALPVGWKDGMLKLDNHEYTNNAMQAETNSQQDFIMQILND